MGAVCFDSNVLIWGLKGQATSGQEDMIVKAQALIAYLTKQKTVLFVPTIVIGELLIPMPNEEHPAFLQLIQKQCIVIPYDIPSAMRFARLWHERSNHSELIAARANGEATKAMLRADCMIVATAIQSKCSCIYTNNVKHLRPFAQSYIEVQPIPDSPEDQMRWV